MAVLRARSRAGGGTDVVPATRTSGYAAGDSALPVCGDDVTGTNPTPAADVFPVGGQPRVGVRT